MLLTTLLIFTHYANAKPKKVPPPPGPSLLQVLTEIQPIATAQAKKCDEWMDKVVDVIPEDARGKSKYPVSILPKLYQKLDEFPNSPAELAEKLELISKGKLKTENAKEESIAINRIESELQRCSPLSSIAFLDNLLESIPEGDTETLKQLSLKLTEKIAPEIEGGHFFATTLIQAGLLESAFESYPERGSWLSSRAGGIFHRGQKLKIRYHKKLLGTSIEENASQYLKIKLEGLKDTASLRQQLRAVLKDAGLKVEKKPAAAQTVATPTTT